MGFDRGSIGFRMYWIPNDWSPEILDRFARHAAPAIESLGNMPVQGWVSMRHLLDRDLSETNCLVAGYLCLALMRAERKVPEALLRAYVRLDEEAALRAGDMRPLSRKQRAEIRQEVLQRLLPTMPPMLTGVQVVMDFRNNLLLIGATSDKACDAVAAAVQSATGFMPVPVTPETAARKRHRLNPLDLVPAAFSPNETVEPGEVCLGDDFLTWLWFYWEREGGVFHLKDLSPEPFALMLEGPLLFFHEAEGAHEAVLRKGSPLLSEEAGTALWCGKKLRRTKFVLALGKQTWSASLDGNAFAVRALRLPKTEQVDPVGSFHERMLALETFWTVLLTLYDRFIDARRDASRWQSTLRGMREWITQRAARHASE